MCVFCKIISGEFESFKIYEDTDTLAVLDISKDFFGHTLVVPKKHCVNMLDCPPETLTSVIGTVQKVSKHYVEKCGFDGVNVFCNNNTCAGQSVMHLHFHIVPQKKNRTQSMFATQKENERNLKEEHARLKINQS